MKKVIPVLSIIAGLYWVVMGFGYAFWVRNGPGGGFLPVLAGIMAIVFSLIMFWQRRKDKSSSGFTWEALIPVATLLGVVLCSYLMGMILSMAVYIFLWLKLAEKFKVIRSLTISICCAAVIYGIFIVWLHVPMPKGLIGLV